MRVARCSVYVDEDSPLHSASFVRRVGRAVGVAGPRRGREVGCTGRRRRCGGWRRRWIAAADAADELEHGADGRAAARRAMAGRERIDATALAVGGRGGCVAWRVELRCWRWWWAPAAARGLLGDGSPRWLRAALVVASCSWRRLGGGAAALRRAWVRRAWERAAIDAGLADGPLRAPRVLSATRVPAGDVLRVRVRRGHRSPRSRRARAELAACLRVREVRVERDPADAAHRARDARAPRPVRGRRAARRGRRPDADELSLWEPVPLGVDEHGEPVAIGLVERNVLVGGEPGAGKSRRALAAGRRRRARPGRRGCGCWTASWSSWRCWAPVAERARRPRRRARRSSCCASCRREMDARYRELLARGLRKVRREDGLPLHLVVCDELAFYLTLPDRKQRQEFAELLRDLVARGRAAGVIVVAATQKPGADVVPTALRDLFGFRLALRCNTPQASDTILGQGWASRRRRRVDDPGRPARRRATCSPRTSGPSGSRPSTSRRRASARSPNAPPRDAPTPGWPRAPRQGRGHGERVRAVMRRLRERISRRSALSRAADAGRAARDSVRGSCCGSRSRCCWCAASPDLLATEPEPAQPGAERSAAARCGRMTRRGRSRSSSRSAYLSHSPRAGR